MTKKFRLEHDSLGSIRVPRDAWYGAQTQRALQNYQISGRYAHPALIRSYLRIKAAAVRANQACGVLSPQTSSLMISAIDTILDLPVEKWRELFPVDPYQAGAGTSQNMNINEVIANFANRRARKRLGSYQPIHPNDHVNRSQSTNDTFPTAMRLAILETSEPLVHEIHALSRTLLRKANAWMEIPKSARTHLQDAVPIRLGQEFKAYGDTLKRCAEWLEHARKYLREIGIGGSAAGTGLTVPKGFGILVIKELARITREPLRLNPDLCEAMQSQSPVSYYSSALRVVALEMTRICNDLRLLASGPMTGFAEILLPEVQPGSSIMPGKVNPSILEMANQTWFSVLGYDQTVAMAVQAGQLELNVMMPIMAYAALEATTLFTNTAMTLRKKAVEGIRPNVVRLKKYFESTPQIATALSPKLGYEKTAKLVKEALKSDISIVELLRKKKLLSESELRSLLDIQELARI